MQHIGKSEALAQRVAVLYQALPSQVVDGLRKDVKPGGYSDSGADVAFQLHCSGVQVVLPSDSPSPAYVFDWVFPDTAKGIEQALRAGATLLWANTVLFVGHPVESKLRDVWTVGQLPALQQRFDDKFATNAMLADAGLPVPAAVLVTCDEARADGVHTRLLDELTEPALRGLGLVFPLIVKPVRGRGSQGVELVADLAALRASARALVASRRFGNVVTVERFLAGIELTVTVMPSEDGPWCLPPVRRFSHEKGVAPYNGAKAVTQNSEALAPAQAHAPAVRAMVQACLRAATLVEARAPIRIDCRADADGVYRLFDLNMKPNMTGAGRPGREDQDSLSAMAARAYGWDYARFLREILAGAWRNP